MRRIPPLVVAVGLLALLVLLASGQNEERASASFTEDDGDVFTIFLEVADTPEERARGLMNRTLREDEGMLFLFNETGEKTFWMKNVPEPLDIIFLSEDWRIVSLFKNLPPCFEEACPLFTSTADARYAIEVRGGFVERHGVEIGDMVKVRY